MKKSLLSRLAKNGNSSFSRSLSKMTVLLFALVALGFLFVGCDNPAGDDGGSPTPTEFPEAWVGTWKTPAEPPHIITLTKTTITFQYTQTETLLTFKSITSLGNEFGVDMYRVEVTNEGTVEVYQFEYYANDHVIEIYDENGNGNWDSQVITYGTYSKQS
ncbi:MAG: hypothetical protein LBK83_10125 [Treponema sp.]|jgi:hypothetical protein|nr:hypothetical protein [Treponema sp.]